MYAGGKNTTVSHPPPQKNVILELHQFGIGIYPNAKDKWSVLWWAINFPPFLLLELFGCTYETVIVWTAKAYYHVIN